MVGIFVIQEVIRYSGGHVSKDESVGEGDELVASALVELVLELHPMETQSVEEALHHVHCHQHRKGEGRPHEVPDPELIKFRQTR